MKFSVTVFKLYFFKCIFYAENVGKVRFWWLDLLLKFFLFYLLLLEKHLAIIEVLSYNKILSKETTTRSKINDRINDDRRTGIRSYK